VTLLNLSVLLIVLLFGLGQVQWHDNLTPVFPHGVSGMARGAGLVFFSYLGFDMVSCLSEEVQDAKRNMPIGIIGSLAVSMTIYISIAIVVVGMTPVALLGNDVPIVNALLANACCSPAQQQQEQSLVGLTHHTTTASCLSYACQPVLHPLLYVASRIVSFGAIFGLTTATFTCKCQQPWSSLF
jgi:amino acid transporter